MRAWSRASHSAAALGVERQARVFEFGHAHDRFFLAGAGFAGLLARTVERGASCASSASIFSMRPRADFQSTLLALQLAGEFGHAAMRHVQRTLRILAVLLGGEQAVAPGGDAALEFVFAVLQFLDLRAQRLDLALAQQRALLGRAGAQHAHPAGAEAFAVAGDHRFAVAQAAAAARALRLRVSATCSLDRMRRIAMGPVTLDASEVGANAIGIVVRIDQRQATFAEFADRIDQRFRRFDQHAFDQLAERAFDGVLPALLDDQLLADARGVVEPALAQPFGRGALLLAQRGVLQGFQRGQAATRGLRLLADFGQFGLRGALLVLQLGQRVLAGFELGGEAVERFLLGVVLLLDAGEGLGQRGQVEAGALAGQRLRDDGRRRATGDRGVRCGCVRHRRHARLRTARGYACPSAAASR